MTPEQLAIFLDRLKACRQPEGRPLSEHTYPRAWNDCLDFVERSIKEIVGEAK